MFNLSGSLVNFCRKGLLLLIAQPARPLTIWEFMLLLIGNGEPWNFDSLWLEILYLYFWPFSLYAIFSLVLVVFFILPFLITCILIFRFLCLYVHCMQVIASLAYLVYFIDGFKQFWLRQAWGFDSELSFYYICGKIWRTELIFLKVYSSMFIINNALMWLLSWVTH